MTSKVWSILATALLLVGMSTLTVGVAFRLVPAIVGGLVVGFLASLIRHRHCEALLRQERLRKEDNHSSQKKGEENL
jgi:hypothetical protein